MGMPALYGRLFRLNEIQSPAIIAHDLDPIDNEVAFAELDVVSNPLPATSVVPCKSVWTYINPWLQRGETDADAHHSVPASTRSSTNFTAHPLILRLPQLVNVMWDLPYSARITASAPILRPRSHSSR